MTPYADFTYFGLLLYLVVPTIILGLLGRANGRWALMATLGALVVQYSNQLYVRPQMPIREIWVVLGYAGFQLVVVTLFLKLSPQLARAPTRGVPATASGSQKGLLPYYAALGLTIGPLIIAKFLPQFSPQSGFGFVGISYVTFRALDVVFSIRDRVVSTISPIQYVAFLFFFPTVSSGPVDRYRRFAQDWQRKRGRPEFLDDLDAAVPRIFRGFFYKFILAALIERHWLEPLARGSGVGDVLGYMYAYTLYLFFDFAGYSAFAIGLSYVLGVHTPENFNLPFLARNIRDFWNRWHISLSFWFRDHVYMRFLLAAAKGRWFKGKHTASRAGLFLTFGLMGVWHGTEPHYLIYGIYHAALLSTYDAFARWNKSRHWGEGRVWHVAQIAITFHAVSFGLLIFSGRLNDLLL